MWKFRSPIFNRQYSTRRNFNFSTHKQYKLEKPTKNYKLGLLTTAAIAGVALYALYESESQTAKAESATSVSMRGVIPTFAKVQDTLKSVGYNEVDNYPQIVVVGIQSSGKSSVLEMIVGEEFIPKGEGTVTKRPLALTLHKVDTDEKWAVFPESGDRKITNFNEVKYIIQKANSKFTDEPLRLDIYSPDVVDLRLVDLPGLIHNPTRDQPQDTRDLIKSSIVRYVQNDKTVILAITEGNTDLQTSEALRFCRKVDPDGERTICVLTKLDMLQPRDSDHLIEVIQKLPLKLGYVGVVCRSKQQRDRGISIPEALQYENTFFNSNTHYKRSGLSTGSPGLAKELSSMLERQVIKALPDITEKIRADLFISSNELRLLGSSSPKTSQERDRLLIDELENYLYRLLGASTIYEIKISLAQQIYKTIYQECGRTLREYSENKPTIDSYNNRTINSKKNTPRFWEGEDDLEFQQWEEQILRLLERLQPLSEEMTMFAVKKLRSKIDESSLALNHRPLLKEAVKNATLKYLNKSSYETVAHIQYLLTLERNITYDGEKMEERYFKLRKSMEEDLKNATKTEDKKEKKDSGSWFSWGNSQTKQQEEVLITGKYGSLWTEAYLDYMTERLSSNIYNAICVEVLDPLKTNLKSTFTIEIFGDDSKRESLLQERGDIAKRREALEKRVNELENSSRILDSLLKSL